MTTGLATNIALAGVVLVALLGLIAWSIATQHADAATRIVRSARRRRRTPARLQVVGRTVADRA
jgi:hypothetical protein